jgi:hypothetical protein
MNFNKVVESIIGSNNDKKQYVVRYDGKKYTTYATSKRAALANIGARIAKENNIKREYYNKFIQKVLDNGRASLIEEKCWKGYKQIGMKKKGKRIVPNCVKKNGKKTK